MAGGVAVLSGETFDQVVGPSEGAVLVAFGAGWNRTTSELAPVLEQIAAEFPEQLRVATINVEEFFEIGKRFDIREVPTLIVFRDGLPAKRFRGYTAPELPQNPSQQQIEARNALTAVLGKEQLLQNLARFLPSARSTPPEPRTGQTPLEGVEVAASESDPLSDEVRREPRLSDFSDISFYSPDIAQAAAGFSNIPPSDPSGQGTPRQPPPGQWAPPDPYGQGTPPQPPPGQWVPPDPYGQGTPPQPPPGQWITSNPYEQRYPPPPNGPTARASGTGLAPNVASLLCYTLTWLTGLIFLLIEKEDRAVRFHAIQAIWFGAVWAGLLIAVNILRVVPLFGLLFFSLGWLVVGLGGFIVWILLMVHAYQGDTWRLPIAGDAAARAVGL
jgi:uncharacterized membrane protein/thiol-disulfide isomerase/thioredoxin